MTTERDPWRHLPKVLASLATLTAAVTGLVVALRPPPAATTAAPVPGTIDVATATVVVPREPGESLGPVGAPPPAPDPEDPEPAPDLDELDPPTSPWPPHDDAYPWCFLLGDGATHHRCAPDAKGCRSLAGWYRPEYPGLTVGKCADRS